MNLSDNIFPSSLNHVMQVLNFKVGPYIIEVSKTDAQQTKYE